MSKCLPARTRRREVFPQPLGPTTASLCPFLTVRVISSNSCVCPSCVRPTFSSVSSVCALLEACELPPPFAALVLTPVKQCESLGVYINDPCEYSNGRCISIAEVRAVINRIASIKKCLQKSCMVPQHTTGQQHWEGQHTEVSSPVLKSTAFPGQSLLSQTFLSLPQPLSFRCKA
jgi:hypothetical protein